MAKSDSQNGPTFQLERRAQKKFGKPIAGIDEAGRGPWAGPVVAAAVILDPQNLPEGLNDSKKLSATERDRLYDVIRDSADVGVGIAEVARIDSDNILQATLWAMRKAVLDLSHQPTVALIDGNKCPDLPCPSEAVVKGDGISLSIAAASIIAKVTRDRIMGQLADVHPAYGWERNKGYGTAEHNAALKKFGVTPHHRRSFKPVKVALGLE